MATPAPLAVPTVTDFHAWPDPHGRFCQNGGQYEAETLMAPLADLTHA